MRIKPPYDSLIIKEYEHWTLVLNERQLPHVGRCYAWYKEKREGQGEGLPLDGLTQNEVLEVSHRIFPEVRTACRALGYQTDDYGPSFLINTSYMANEGHNHNHHMHVHFVPRHREPLLIPSLDIHAEDRLWGKHYARGGWEELKLKDAQTLAIRLIVAEAIGGKV